ncbi:Lymphocyte activation protein 3 protein [Saguinus oedipus]|uniref:Lymphocyte activation protein 3 protein n=1 Tax=Saguinus oedipus TaxID=9490 RepID=A0ABQ9UWY3_SAGOE|nr:Lymphocyte activation protein 3 protein [Saguinus oedipus]
MGTVGVPGHPPAPGPRRYTVLSVAPGGLRSGRLPLQPRVQLEERGRQRGDFSLWLRPARRADAGEYRAAVHLRDRTLSCHLRLRVGRDERRGAAPPKHVYGGPCGEIVSPPELTFSHPRGRGERRSRVIHFRHL